MAERENLSDVTRQVLVIGTSCITDSTGNIGYKTDVVQASAQVRIAEALEKQTDVMLATRAGFSPEQHFDGLNHVQVSQMKGTRLVQIDILATSHAMGVVFIEKICEVIKAAIAAVEEGGTDNG